MNPTILILEPNKAYRDQFKNVLTGTKYMVVREVEYGEEALALYEQINPSVVVMCLCAPGNKSGTGIGGINLVKKFVELDPGVKIAVTYTSSSKYLVMAALKAGALAQLKKPFTKDGVLHALATALSARSGAEAVKRQSLRLRKSLVVHYKKVDEGFLARMRTVISDDISATGIRFRVEESIPEKSILKLKMELPGTQRTIVKATGQVVRAKPVPGMNMNELGINFIEMTDQDRQLIKRYVLNVVSAGGKAGK